MVTPEYEVAVDNYISAFKEKKHFFDEIIEKVSAGQTVEMFYDQYRTFIDFNTDSIDSFFIVSIFIWFKEFSKSSNCVKHSINICFSLFIYLSLPINNAHIKNIPIKKPIANSIIIYTPFLLIVRV